MLRAQHARRTAAALLRGRGDRHCPQGRCHLETPLWGDLGLFGAEHHRLCLVSVPGMARRGRNLQSHCEPQPVTIFLRFGATLVANTHTVGAASCGFGPHTIHMLGERLSSSSSWPSRLDAVPQKATLGTSSSNSSSLSCPVCRGTAVGSKSCAQTTAVRTKIK